MWQWEVVQDNVLSRVLTECAVQMNITAQCRSHLMTTQEDRLRNWRLDYGLRKQCKADVAEV